MARFWAVALKEFIQMRRDRMTFGMMIGIPVLQLLLFSYAINSNPRNLPAAVIPSDSGVFGRTMVAAMKNSGYFDFNDMVAGERDAEELMRRGLLQFVVHFQPGFHQKMVRGERPQILLEMDASDPASVAYASAAFASLGQNVFRRDLLGATDTLQPAGGPVEFVTHRKYNPEIDTRVNIVPGLLGVILTMTMVFITALAVTREKERGTMEHLLSTPLTPAEVMAGKIVPYIMIGYVQISLVLALARFLFDIPILGSVSLLFLLSLVFIAANLAVGVTFSTLARNQLQAVQMSVFFFLPSMILSGFMFPFLGMPQWARAIGGILPLTHYLVMVRGVLLKGCGFQEIQLHFYAILAFLAAVVALGLLRYRRTLD